MNENQLNKNIFSVNETLMIIVCILFLLGVIFVMMYALVYFSFECACDTACYDAGYKPFNETGYLDSFEELEIIYPQEFISDEE